MRENLQCNCHICKIERHLIASLSESPRSDEFLKVAHDAAPLSGFSSALALVEHLHTRGDGATSVPSASEVIGSLIQSSSTAPEKELRNSVLVLSFVPMIHRTYREVRAWFREIESEDIAQQILTLFLELVTSTSPTLMNNHLPIALTRTLRKNAFRWAEMEKRIAIQREAEKTKEIAEPFASPGFEMVSVLNDYLDYCQRIGILSVFERDLLIRLKIEGFFAKEIAHTHTALSEKAVHWRVERILQRLQKAANDLVIKDASLSLADSSKNPKKRKNNSKTAGKFSSGSQTDFLPISKSRRQLSLDSSPSQSKPKQQQLSAIHRNLLTTSATLPSAIRRTRVIPGAAPQRHAAIRSSGFPPTLARHPKSGERLSSNPDAGLPRIIRKELAGNEEILSKQDRLPLATPRVHRIFLLSGLRDGCLRSSGRWVALGERSQRADAGVHDYHRARSLTRLHCGRRTDLRLW
jgi:DNA-directed RNA polymerase specialized sigma24 family protein